MATPPFPSPRYHQTHTCHRNSYQDVDVDIRIMEQAIAVRSASVSTAVMMESVNLHRHASRTHFIRAIATPRWTNLPPRDDEPRSQEGRCRRYGHSKRERQAESEHGVKNSKGSSTLKAGENKHKAENEKKSMQHGKQTAVGLGATERHPRPIREDTSSGVMLEGRDPRPNHKERTTSSVDSGSRDCGPNLKDRPTYRTGSESKAPQPKVEDTRANNSGSGKRNSQLDSKEKSAKGTGFGSRDLPANPSDKRTSSIGAGSKDRLLNPDPAALGLAAETFGPALGTKKQMVLCLKAELLGAHRHTHLIQVQRMAPRMTN